MKQEFTSTTMRMGLLMISLSWLIPNKAYPWLAAWNEGAAFIAVFFIWLSAALITPKARENTLELSWPLVYFCIIGIVTVFLQYATGLLIFYGDAVILTLYLGMFLLAGNAAALMAESKERDAWLGSFMNAISLGGIISVGIALTQWTKTWDLAIFMLEEIAGDRPGANLGQINHFNTLCFISCCAILFLLQTKKLTPPIFLAASIFLTLGMALSQSRTGWLQIIFALCVVLIKSTDRRLKIAFLTMFLIYSAWYLSLPEIGHTLQLTAESNFRSIPTDDVRMTMWHSLWEASRLSPWFGYGWLQTGWAQQTVAEDFPILRSYMSYGHNVVLDLVIWNGLPIAIILTSLLALWIVKNLRSNLTHESLLLFCASIGLFIHATLEYPLSYAYFLIPLGFIMGTMDGINSQFNKIRLNIKIQYGFVIIIFAIFIKISLEYFTAVETDTLVRMNDSKIGTSQKQHADVPHFFLLSQLEAMYRVRALNTEEETSDGNIALLKDVVRRYPYSPAIVQYAWALASRGDTTRAQKELRVLCGIYSPAHCEKIKMRWAALQKKYPTAAAGIDFPEIARQP